MKAKAERIMNEPGTGDSGPVKEQARTALARQTLKFPNRAALDAAVKSVFDPLRSKGLKSLEAVPRRNQPGRFDLIAKASPEEEVGEAEVETGGGKNVALDKAAG